MPTKEQRQERAEEEKKTKEQREAKPIFTDKHYKSKKSKKKEKERKKKQLEALKASLEAPKKVAKTKVKKVKKAPARKVQEEVVVTPEITYHQTPSHIEIQLSMRPDTTLDYLHIDDRAVNMSVVHYTMEKGRSAPHNITLALREFINLDESSWERGTDANTAEIKLKKHHEHRWDRLLWDPKDIRFYHIKKKWSADSDDLPDDEDDVLTFQNFYAF